MVLSRFETNESKHSIFKLFSPKSGRIFGAAGEFCCHSLHRSQNSKDL